MTYTVDVFDERSKTFIITGASADATGVRVMVKNMTNLKAGEVSSFLTELSVRGKAMHRGRTTLYRDYTIFVRTH